MTERSNGKVKLAVLASAATGFALTLAAFYPGYMTNDAGFVYGFIKDWRFGDWQSPLMSMLWWAIDPISPGPGSMFLLVATLYWLGFGIVALVAARRSAWLGLALPVLALAPPAFLFLAMIWRDILFAGVWLFAGAIIYACADRIAPLRLPVQALALGLIGFGVLLRPNAIIAAPLLAAYAIWPAAYQFKRTAIVFIPMLVAGYGLLHVVYYVLLDVKREHPAHSLMVFDLGGITHFTGENQFPVTWSAPETALLTSRCYNPERWDTYWTIEPCSFVMRRLEAKDDLIFGTPQLTEAWMHAVIAHPLAYLRHRATYMWAFLAGPTLTLELYHMNDASFTPLARNSLFQALMAMHERLKPTPLFQLGAWLLAALAIGLSAWPRRATPSGAFAIAVTASGGVYVMSFLPLGVAAEFRYGYWCVLASLVGAAVVLASRREQLAGR